MAETSQTNLLNVASHYIKLLQAKVTAITLRERLYENPYYPSLFSLSNTFDRFNIRHEAFTVEKENLDELTTPFIAYVKNLPTGKDFILVTSVTNTGVSYIAANKKVQTIAKEKFLNDWEKIVLKAETNNESGEKDYLQNRKKEIANKNKTYSLIAAATFIFIATVYFFIKTLPVNFIAGALIILAIKLFGLAISVLLLVYEIDKSNAFVKSICTAGKQTNCNAVLQSKASKIGGMTWSEAGFFYFASTFLFLLFPSVSFANKTAVLSIANCIAAPYILFSIYYQWKVVKQWCPLCLMVQGVLLMELIWSIANFWMHLKDPEGLRNLQGLHSLAFYLLLFTLLLIPIVLWYTIKPILLKAKNEPVYKAAYKRLLYNPETFNNLLQQQQTAPAGYENLGITIGNPNAINTIIKVCNPYCGPCAKAHAAIDEILRDNKNVKLKLIFTASNDANDKRGIAAKHLLAINAKQNTQQTEQALDDWYLADKKDYNAFAGKYPMNGELKEQEAQIELMRNWCNDANITHTPTLFINGKQLPETYTIDELKYIL